MQTRGKKRERNGEREDTKRRHLSFLLLAHRAFVAHAVRLACGCSFPFPGKGKECSYYRQVLISSVSYKVLRTLTLGSTKGGG